MQEPIKELPQPHDQLLLPKPHFHAYVQVVLFVIGILSLIGGIVLTFIGYSSSSSLQQSGNGYGNLELLFFFAAGSLIGIGVTAILIWALWRFFHRYRDRFVVSLAVSTIMLVTGILSVSTNENVQPTSYTYYFIAISSGLLIGLASLFYFLKGVSKHAFRDRDTT